MGRLALVQGFYNNYPYIQWRPPKRNMMCFFWNEVRGEEFDAPKRRMCCVLNGGQGEYLPSSRVPVTVCHGSWTLTCDEERSVICSSIHSHCRRRWRNCYSLELQNCCTFASWANADTVMIITARNMSLCQIVNLSTCCIVVSTTQI